MNRREFSKAVAGAIGVAGAPADEGRVAGEDRSTAPYQISVMLWTVFTKLPVSQRLERVAEAGYRNVELVGEYRTKWSEAEFREAKAKRKELKLQLDITAGLKHGIANPADREALLANVRNELPTMDMLRNQFLPTFPSTCWPFTAHASNIRLLAPFHHWGLQAAYIRKASFSTP